MDDSRIAKCDELLELLYAHDDLAKLRALIIDIEDLRERLRRGESVTSLQAGRERAGEDSNLRPAD
jgi:hypothetical protein